VTHFNTAMAGRARQLVALYPEPRSALLPLCHLAQEQDGWLRPEAMAEIAELVGVTPAEVRGTATFYDMLHTEPVGKYVVAVCTNIACILDGATELLAHAEDRLGVRVGATTADGLFTLEESECLADCDHPPCVQVNHRFVRTTTAEQFDRLVQELTDGGHSEDIPPHGTLVRIRRSGGLRVEPGEIARERALADQSTQEGSG
jgi:NADH-quinone oxidoreductase E subunit